MPDEQQKQHQQKHLVRQDTYILKWEYKVGWEFTVFFNIYVPALGLSCPTARGILVSWPGIKFESPALEGGFLTIGPPGESLNLEYWSEEYARKKALDQLSN